MVTHSSILAWRILWMEEPAGLQSMRLQRVGQDGATTTFTFSFKPGTRLKGDQQSQFAQD